MSLHLRRRTRMIHLTLRQAVSEFVSRDSHDRQPRLRGLSRYSYRRKAERSTR